MAEETKQENKTQDRFYDFIIFTYLGDRFTLFPCLFNIVKTFGDEIGTIFAGAAFVKDKLDAYLDMFSGSDATAIGLGKKASLQNAALVNGLSGHVHDYDDGHVRYFLVHVFGGVLYLYGRIQCVLAGFYRGHQ